MFSLWICALLAVPFEDTAHRFRVELPDGWTWTPQPGDTTGAWFKKVDTGAIGRMGIRVLADTSVEQAQNAATRMVFREPGYRLISESRVMLPAGGLKRELVYFVGASDKVSKRIEQIFVANGRVTYWLHFEALAEGFDLFAKDREAFYRTFTPIAGGQRILVAGEKAKKLIGRWQRQDDGFILEFKGDGNYILGALAGQFLVMPTKFRFSGWAGRNASTTRSSASSSCCPPTKARPCAIANSRSKTKSHCLGAGAPKPTVASSRCRRGEALSLVMPKAPIARQMIYSRFVASTAPK